MSRELKSIISLSCIAVIVGCSAAVEPIVETRLKLAEAYLALDDLSNAYDNLSIALQYAGDDWRVELVMAQYEQKVGYLRDAEQRLIYLINRYPHNVIIRNNYAMLLCGLGQYNKAIQQFSLVFSSQHYSVVAEALEQAGFCALSNQRFDDAERYFIRMLNFDQYRNINLLYRVDVSDVVSAKFLVNVYERSQGVSAQSLLLKIKLAALEDRPEDVILFGELLAQYFSQTKQYRQFIANEY